MVYYTKRPEANFVVDRIIKWIVDVVVVVAIGVFLAIFLCDEQTVIGNSMSPALDDGQVVLINRMFYELKDPDRFDVIVYESKTTKGQYVVKRIIGLPGETVKITDSKIYINGELLEDKYFKGSYESGYVEEEIKIGADEYFVMGDNRNLSEDSRFSYIGNIKEEDIVGKAWLISSPFSEIGFVK